VCKPYSLRHQYNHISDIIALHTNLNSTKQCRSLNTNFDYLNPCDVTEMTLTELEMIIKRCGGHSLALEYAHDLFPKLKRVAAHQAPINYLRQFSTAHNEGDLRGRVLEINFANYFAVGNVPLEYEVKQAGSSGDIDLRWQSNHHDIYIEIKLLGQQQSKQYLREQNFFDYGFSNIQIPNDIDDIKRIQYTLIDKAKTAKFNPTPTENGINLIAIDVSELQLGTVDIGDCLLATLGSTYTATHFSESCARDELIGLFERNQKPNAWSSMIEQKLAGKPHPSSYIHGIVFLFREPKETAALSYDLAAQIVWNPHIITIEKAREVTEDFHRIIPLEK